MCGNKQENDARAPLDRFQVVMEQVYNSKIDEKMELTFHIFDFDFDGLNLV